MGLNLEGCTALTALPDKLKVGMGGLNVKGCTNLKQNLVILQELFIKEESHLILKPKIIRIDGSSVKLTEAQKHNGYVQNGYKNQLKWFTHIENEKITEDTYVMHILPFLLNVDPLIYLGNKSEKKEKSSTTYYEENLEQAREYFARKYLYEHKIIKRPLIKKENKKQKKK
jgi:hypothetical protein